MKPVSRGALAADPLIGAGNVLQRLLDLGADPDGPGLSFDTAVEQHPAEHRRFALETLEFFQDEFDHRRSFFRLCSCVDQIRSRI